MKRILNKQTIVTALLALVSPMQRWNRIVMLVAILAAGIAVHGQEVSARFSRESITLGQVTLLYRKAEICHSGARKPVLVLYLHGGSSRGSDNEAQLQEKAVSVIYQYLLLHDIPATFIVPQCPSGGGWTSQNRKVVNELLKSYVKEGTVDADRIYVMGGSMGGTGTWCQLSYFPDFYAAAMPVAGNPTGMNAANVATTPVLTVMGTADAMMSITDVETFMADVIAAGGSVRLDTEEGWSHPTTCEQSYTEERLDWLFSQVRGVETGIREMVNSKWSNGKCYDLVGRPISLPASGIYIKDGKKYIQRKR
ncbi:MAG: prolyl oligopeptidase family serine peptidase [Bacteroidaceae bacterium]|nr:prolyl oligopeptidase family serine peptidase [Bacteroidaceae bacterium]